jgi:hypothetical protein
MHQQLWGYKVEEKLYLGVREQKRLNTTALEVNSHYKQHVLHALELTVHRQLLIFLFSLFFSFLSSSLFYLILLSISFSFFDTCVFS